MIIIRKINHIEFGKEITKERNNLGLTQKKFAEAVGVSQQRIAQIENGDPCSTNLRSKILKYIIGKENIKFEVIVDWVNISFTTNDFREIIKNVLEIDINLMESKLGKLHNYEGFYELNGIRVHYSNAGSVQGTLISMSGSGCRFYEALKPDNGCWETFFKRSIENYGTATMIHLAINDYIKVLDIAELFRKYENDELITSFRTIKPEMEYNIKTKECNGMTLYFGSRKGSNIYFRFYEKDMEQATKTGQHRDTFAIKNRYEIVLKGDKARELLREIYFTGVIIDKPFNIISHYLKFVDKEDDVDKGDWKINEDWATFLRNAQHLSLTTDASIVDDEKIIRWFNKSLVYTICYLLERDRILKTNVFWDSIDEHLPKLPKKYKNLLQSLTIIQKNKEVADDK